ncbi:hypothetical protein JX266_012460 [Neoarthrinium moseri]|nr:hypothetical protein JX266_012460 [Neoarthrinium moseri]
MSSTSRNVTTQGSQVSRPSNSNEIARLQKGAEELQSWVGELLPTLAKPEKFKQTFSEIVNSFNNVGGTSKGRQIAAEDLRRCTELLGSFQNIAQKELEAPPDPADATKQVIKFTGTQDLVARKSKMQKITTGVEVGMVIVAKEAIKTSADRTTGLDLTGVEDFAKMLECARSLVEKASLGLTGKAPPGEDPAAHLESVEDPVYAYAGPEAMLQLDDFEDRPPLETRQGQSWTGSS